MAYVATGGPAVRSPLPDASRIGAWFWDTGVKRAGRSSLSSWWIENSKALLCVSDIDEALFAFLGTAELSCAREMFLAARCAREKSDRIAHAGRPFMVKGDGWVRLRLGPAFVIDARYFALVEGLYPGCVWRAPGYAHQGPAVAWVGDAVVAIVMGVQPILRGEP